MKYYKLRYNSDLKEVGAFPHCEEGKELGDVQQDFMHLPTYIDFDFRLPEPNLVKTANQTSLIQSEMIPAWFLVINNSFLAFLKNFQLGRHQAWKLKTWQNESLIDAYNLFLTNETMEASYIDFSKSEFYSGSYSDFTYKGEKITVNNHAEYLKCKTTLREDKLWLRESKVVFDMRRASEDMFRIGKAPFSGYYVSERLKNAIEERGYTGMIFTPLSVVNKKIEVIY